MELGPYYDHIMLFVITHKHTHTHTHTLTSIAVSRCADSCNIKQNTLHTKKTVKKENIACIFVQDYSVTSTLQYLFSPALDSPPINQRQFEMLYPCSLEPTLPGSLPEVKVKVKHQKKIPTNLTYSVSQAGQTVCWFQT